MKACFNCSAAIKEQEHMKEIKIKQYWKIRLLISYPVLFL